jgi:hypothetical protein
MPMVMIRCPQTGQEAFTGIETDRVSFRRLPDTGGQLRCPICGRQHIWGKRDARLSEDSTFEPKRVAGR